MANRFGYDNQVLLGTTTITASSAQDQSPASHLKDQQRQKTWRSPVGWTITDDNNKIDGNRSGPGDWTATIVNGYYATGASLATAVITALTAADAGITWGVDYNVIAADKFRIRDTSGAPLNFTLKWNTGSNAYRSVAKCMGFAVTADDSGDSTYTSDTVTYQSRQFLRFDLGATSDITMFVFLQHNLLSTKANLILEANGSDAWSSPSYSTTFSGVTTDPIYSYIGTRSFRYWRVSLNNTQETSGYTEVGVVYLGTYTEPSICYADDLTNELEPFTQVMDAIAGSRYANVQSDRERWAIGWKELDSSARATLDTFFQSVAVGEAFFFDFDTTASDQLVYVTRESRSWRNVPTAYRDYTTQLVEVI